MLLPIVSWLSSILFAFLAIGLFAQGDILPGITSLLLAIYLCPPIRKAIHQSVGKEMSRKGRITVAIGLFVLFLIPTSRSISIMAAEEERLIAIEQARKDSIEKVQLDSITAYEEKRTAFLQTAPFVTEAEYDEWQEKAGDSLSSPSLTVGEFLASTKHRVDSIAEKRRIDSVGQLRRVAEYQRKEEEEARRERAQLTAEEAKRKRMCTYKGHPLIQGPRGGCYYINSHGNKEYVQVECSGC